MSAADPKAGYAKYIRIAAVKNILKINLAFLFCLLILNLLMQKDIFGHICFYFIFLWVDCKINF